MTLDALAGFDAAQPDGLLVALAAAPGVEPAALVIRSWPRPGGHGRHAVTWSQDGRSRTAEASTLAAALRRAVRDAGPRSAPTAPRPAPAEPGRSVFRAAP